MSVYDGAATWAYSQVPFPHLSCAFVIPAAAPDTLDHSKQLQNKLGKEDLLDEYLGKDSIYRNALIVFH